MNWTLGSRARRSRRGGWVAGAVLFGVAAAVLAVRVSRSDGVRGALADPLARLNQWAQTLGRSIRTRLLPPPTDGVALETEPRIGSAALQGSAQQPEVRSGAPVIESEPRSGVKLS